MRGFIYSRPHFSKSPSENHRTPVRRSIGNNCAHPLHRLAGNSPFSAGVSEYLPSLGGGNVFEFKLD